jgi:HAD superfamily hydrolase (TIGR01509 family)
MLKALLWDNDGVLVDTETLYYQANQLSLARLGINLTAEIYGEISLNKGDSVLDLARSRGLNDQEVRTLRDQRNNEYMQLLERNELLISGALDTLSHFSGRLKMALVTSSYRAYIDIIERKTGYLRYFNTVITRDIYHRSKPDPEPYLLALDALKIKPEESLVIEDTLRGLNAAKAGGIPCLIIPNSFNRHQMFPGALKVLPDISRVIPFLEPDGLLL